MDDNHLYITKEKLEEFQQLAFKEYGVESLQMNRLMNKGVLCLDYSIV